MKTLLLLLVSVTAIVEASAVTAGSSNDPLAAELQRAGAGADWWSRAREQLELGEYCVSGAEDALLAVNRAQNLTARFNDAGVLLVPGARRKADESRASWGWQTVSWGTEGDMRPLPAVTPSSSGSRVIYSRGALTEWYENRKEGFEQVFEITSRPPGRGALCIEGLVTGALTSRQEDSGEAIEYFDSEGHRVFRYANLSVRDAVGRELVARLVLAGARVRILIEADVASYPILVDPILDSPHWRVESNDRNQRFGFSVAAAGDVNGDGFSDIIVGGPYLSDPDRDEGAAYVYLGSAAGLPDTWDWMASGEQIGAEFGGSVAAAGDVNGDGYGDIIIGARSYDGGEVGEGAAFVWYGSETFELRDDGTPDNCDWHVEGDQLHADLGVSVASAGDVNGDGYSDVIVGADDRALVYFGDPAGLPMPALAWVATGDDENVNFGFSVSGAGDVNGDGFSDIMVGDFGYRRPPGELEFTFEGIVYVWNGSATFASDPDGTPANADWSHPGGEDGDQFGRSVAAAGDVNGDGYADIIVGAPGFSDPESEEGRAFVFYGGNPTPSGLRDFPDWYYERDRSSAHLGWSVQTAGDLNGDGYADVIVGAGTYRVAGESDPRGEVSVFYGSPSGLDPDWDWRSLGESGGDSLGFSVAAAGDVNGDGYGDILIGAPAYGNPDAVERDEGAAYVYFGSASGPSDLGQTSAAGDQGHSAFGHQVAVAGDVNGDGYSDIVVGAPWYDHDFGDQGKVSVFYGKATGFGPDPDWTAEGDRHNANLGYSVARAGDVNGDGYSDIIVGAYGFSGDHDAEGMVAVYLGSAEGLLADPDWTAVGDQDHARFGESIGAAGDVNGDGYGDVIVGAKYYENGETEEGAAFVWYGGPDGLGEDGTPATADWFAEGDQDYARFGCSVGTAGDVDSDGDSEVLIGASGYADSRADEGAAFAWYGALSSGLGESGSAADADWIVYGGQMNAHLGVSVATAGDVDHDGYSDVIVGVPGYSGGDPYEGAALLYRGRATGLDDFFLGRIVGGEPFAGYLGESVASAGDVNGDGYSDVVIGSPGYDGGQTNQGRMIVWPGGPWEDWAHTDPIFEISSGRDDSQFGWSVTGAGDVNGDGFADVLVGGYLLDGEAGAQAGAVTAYYGNQVDNVTWDIAGTPRIARQRGVDVSVPIDLLGNSDGPTSFRLNALGRTPAGRGRVRLEWEVEPLGTPFDAAEIDRGTWMETGAPAALGSSVDLDELVTGLSLLTPYHWRLRIASSSPSFPWSPWLSLPYNNGSETDLRTPGGYDISAYTPIGQYVTVHLGPDVTLIFENVTAPGVTELTVMPDPTLPPPPYPFQVIPASSPLFYRISTSAGLGGSIETCMRYGAGDVQGSEIALELLQLLGPAAWQPITASRDTVAHRICGTTTTLSTFALAEPVTGSTGVPHASPSLTFRLFQNVPNPFNPVTTIAYEIPRPGRVSLRIYDVAGRLIRTLVNAAESEAGEHRVIWDGRAEDGRLIASGVYFCQLEAGGRHESRRVVLTK